MARKENIRIKRTRVKNDVPAERPAPQPTPRFAGMQYENELEEAARAAAEKRAARQKKPKTKRRLILLAIVVVLAVVVWAKWDVLNPASVWNYINVAVTGGESGDGYPTEAEGSNVIAMRPVGGYLLVVTQNTVTAYNQSAGTVFSRSHSFSDPLVDVAGNSIMLAEIGGRRIEVQSVGGKVRTLETAKNIVTASVADNGSVAAVTASDKSHISEIVVFDNKGEEKLYCYSSEALLTGIAMRSDGRQMAAIGVLANNGAPQSRLLVYSTFSEKDPKVYSGNDTLLCDVEYLDNDSIAAVGDDRVWVVKTGKNEPEEITYESRHLLSWAVSGDRVGVVLQNYGATEGGQLLAVDKSGKTAYTVDFSGMFRAVAPAGKEFFLMCGNDVMTMNGKGETKTKEVLPDALRICRAFGNDALVLGLTSIERYDY